MPFSFHKQWWFLVLSDDAHYVIINCCGVMTIKHVTQLHHILSFCSKYDSVGVVACFLLLDVDDCADSIE